MTEKTSYRVFIVRRNTIVWTTQTSSYKRQYIHSIYSKVLQAPMRICRRGRSPTLSHSISHFTSRSVSCFFFALPIFIKRLLASFYYFTTLFYKKQSWFSFVLLNLVCWMVYFRHLDFIAFAKEHILVFHFYVSMWVDFIAILVRLGCLCKCILTGYSGEPVSDRGWRSRRKGYGVRDQLCKLKQNR